MAFLNMCLIRLLFYCLFLKVSGETLPEGSPDRTTVCAEVDLLGSCVNGEVIVVQSVNYGTKLKATCPLHDNSSACCAYGSGDCFTPDYTGTDQQAACSGRSLCNSVQISKEDTSSCGANYPILNHYLTIEYYCIQESTRISPMCTSSTLTSTGSLLYIKNQDYPNAIRAADKNCSCSVEVGDCSSRIKIYLVHFQLGDGGGTCTGTQQLQIDDEGTATTLTCSANTDFEITLKLTSSSNYITVTQANPGGVNDGYFWLGFEETSGSVPISINCPAASRTMCMDCPTLTAPPDGSLSTSGVGTGTSVTVLCDPNFTLDGATPIVCQTDGNWDNTVGVCRPDCPGLNNQANGQVNATTAVSTGQSAFYTCDGGYSIIGDDTRTCQGDGTWSGSEPVCGSCPVLSSPTNGQRTVTGYSPGDTATYTCSQGYLMSGTATRTCQAGNTWSGSAPSCTARTLGDSCSADADCSSVVDDSVCNSLGECNCKDGYREQNRECEAEESDDGGGLSGGAIAGIVIGCIAVVAIIVTIIVVVIYLEYRHKGSQNPEQKDQ